MKIYTKTGDRGETSLFGGKRVSKTDLRIECYGTVDELNSILGVVRSEKCSKKISEMLNILQNELFIIGAELATPTKVKSKVINEVSAKSVIRLEKLIDELEEKLSPLKNFILPGGSRAGSILHFARTVCRRAERLVVTLSKKEEVDNKIIIYLNRLSDLLFVMARFQNKTDRKKEVKWEQKKC